MDVEQKLVEQVSNPELDASDERFDPLRALYSPSTSANRNDVKIYDNLSQFDYALNRLGVFDVGRILPPAPKLQTKSEKTVDEDLLGMDGRRFLASQAPIPTTVKKRHNRSLFTYLDEEIEGPLDVLRKYVEKGQRVHVYVRKQKGVRGVTTGILKMFDKNWNVMLEDACEVWKRRKYKYSEHQDYMAAGAKDCSARLRSLGIELPPMEVKSVHRKYVECQRRSKQLMIRGEQVVLIASSTSA